MGRSPPNIAAIPSIECCGAFDTEAWVDAPPSGSSGVIVNSDVTQDNGAVAMEIQSAPLECAADCQLNTEVSAEAAGSAPPVRRKPQPYPRGQRNADYTNANNGHTQDMSSTSTNNMRTSGSASGSPKVGPPVPRKPRLHHSRLHRTKANGLPRRSAQGASRGLEPTPKGFPPRENMSSFDSIEAFAGSNENLASTSQSDGPSSAGGQAVGNNSSNGVSMETGINSQGDAAANEELVAPQPAACSQESGAANDNGDPDSEVSLPVDGPSIGNSSATDNQSEGSLQMEELEEMEMETDGPSNVISVSESHDSQSDDGVLVDNPTSESEPSELTPDAIDNNQLHTIHVSVTTTSSGSIGTVTTIAAQLARIKTIESAVSNNSSSNDNTDTVGSSGIGSADTVSLASGSSADSSGMGSNDGTLDIVSTSVAPAPAQAIGAQIVVTAQPIGHEVSRPLRGVAHAHAIGPAIAMAIAQPVAQQPGAVTTLASHESGINPQGGVSTNTTTAMKSGQQPQVHYGVAPSVSHVMPHYAAQNASSPATPLSAAASSGRSSGRIALRSTSQDSSTDGGSTTQTPSGSPSYASRSVSMSQALNGHGSISPPLTSAATSSSAAAAAAAAAARRRLLSEEEREQNRAAIQQQLVQWHQSRATPPPTPPPRAETTRLEHVPPAPSSSSSGPPPPPPRDGSSLSSAVSSQEGSPSHQPQSAESTASTRQAIHQELQRWRQQHQQQQQHLEQAQLLQQQQQQSGQQPANGHQGIQQLGQQGSLDMVHPEYADVVWERRSATEALLQQQQQLQQQQIQQHQQQLQQQHQQLQHQWIQRTQMQQQQQQQLPQQCK